MTATSTLPDQRAAIRAHTLSDEAGLARRLIGDADIGREARKRAQNAAKDFVRDARANASRSGLIDKFLQEYGLSTAEGVTLMRLAEALLRTPDAATADALIEDKIEAGDWASHKGASPFPLVNFSTRALMFTASWIDDIEPKNPAGKIAAATKDLLDRVGEPVIRSSVAQAMRIMGEHFVLGQTIDEAGKRAEHYRKDGYTFSYDMLGEAAHTQADALKYFNDYASAIAAIAKRAHSNDPRDNPGISVKLSALHPRYEYAKKERVIAELGARTRDLAIAAKNANIGFNIDAEEADRLDLSLDLIEMLMRDPALAGWDGFGVVVQAYQRRASFVLDWLATLARETGRRIMVRLVKGAYWDSEIKRAQVMGLESYPVFTRKVLTDISYTACARKLLSHNDVFYPQFATHNALTAAMVSEMAGSSGDYELQRLHGMGEALHDRLLEQGVKSRIYAPVGGHKELLPYLVRRLLENGANSSFVNQLLDPDLSVDDVIADPIDEAMALNVLPNTAIPAPRDLFAGERLSALGWDETAPETAAHLQEACAQEIAIETPPLSGAQSPVANPARRDKTLGVVKTATAEDVAQACATAKRAQSQWAARDDRAAVLQRAGDILEQRGEDFIALACQEAGKTIPDAIAEVREAVDFLRYYANRAQHLTREPLGVVACISPWNFPLAIFLGQVAGALSAGNAVIAKPAEQTPLIAARAVALLHEAGVPGDVLHYMPGDGPSVGGPLVADRAVNGVAFTGSTATAQAINRSLKAAGKHHAPLIAETGGINAMIIDSTALLEQAVSDVVASAFQSAGQRCSACRVVCVQSDIADRFNEMLKGATAELRIGAPSLLRTDVGPVIDDDARLDIQNHIDAMQRSARLVAQAPPTDADVNGAFVRPVAFELNDIAELKREVFGPVLHVVRFDGADLTAMIDKINALGFGLTMGLHSRIDETMETVAARARIGNIYVNRNQIGAVVGVQPFGGEGLSGTGPKAGGPHYLDAFVKPPKPPVSHTEIAIAPDGALPAVLDARLRDIGPRMTPWSNLRDKEALFNAAAATASDPLSSALSQAADVFRAHFKDSEDLPSSTGEANTLKLRGRGVMLCVGERFLDQAAKALAAGNAIVTADPLAESLRAALPAEWATLIISIDQGPIPVALLGDDRLAGVVADVDEESHARLAGALAARPGAIIPLLSSADQPWRFAVERTLSINTTAAGGDVRLLSLPE